MKRILVIGAQNIDLYARSESEYQLHDSNISKIDMAFGGVACNIATNLSKLGNEIHFLTVFGDDHFSEISKQNLTSLNINYEESLTVLNARNSIYLGIMDKSNNLFIGLNDMDITQQLDSKFLETKRNYIEGFDVLVIDNNLCKDALGFLLMAYKHKKLIMDAVSAAKAIKLAGLVSNIDLLKVNTLELEALSNKPDIKTGITDLLNKGVGAVLLTNSEKEIIYRSKDQYFVTMPAIIDKVVNSTGAGDALLSGYINSMIKDESVEKCLESAKLAAQNCLRSANSTIEL